ncbi:MAG: hypothetical protein WKF57_08460 [Nakamurella sp.]
MSDTTITVSPAVLYLDVGGGVTSDTAEVKYSSLNKIVMWERLNLGVWTKLNLFLLVGTADADMQGSFPTPVMRPGDLLEYRSYFYSNVDPRGRTTPRDMFTGAQVQALVSVPEEQPWITDQTTDVGGTFYRRIIATPPLFTAIHAEIGTGTPSRGTFGELILPNVVATADSQMKPLHTLELLPLLAGQRYVCTLRINDSAGNWFTLVEDLTTLLRTVTIDVDSVFINNDGDPAGAGEAEFWITTYEGDTQIDQIHFGDDENDVYTGTAVPLSNQIVRGPKAVTDTDHDIGVNAAGIEYDGFLEADEHANTWGHPPHLRRQLDFPAGSGRESLSHQYFQVPAVPGSVDDDFAFTVIGHYSVAYT